MRRIIFPLIFLAALLCSKAMVISSFAQTEASEPVDTPIFFTTINGKTVPATALYCRPDKSNLGYAIREPFMENDTQYIWREFHLWKCDTCNSYDTCVISYFIIPGKNKDHLASVLRTYYVKDPDFKGNTYLSDDYHLWREYFPEMTLERNKIGNMPRHWFRVKNYQGQYVLTSDYPYGLTFTDSMIIHHGMETWFSKYGKVKKIKPKTYYYEKYDYSNEDKCWYIERNWLHPSILVKGLYVNTTLTTSGAISHTLVTPQENLQYFDLIQAEMCELIDLDYDEVDYEAHTDPALMAEIRAKQSAIKSQRIHEQAMKLQSAYKHHSVDELYQFFDNWASDIQSTETADDSPYLAEAYNVYRAFYQPLLSDYKGVSYYKDKPYYIIQGSLWKISEAECIILPHERDSFFVARIRQSSPNDTVYQNETIQLVLKDKRKRPCYGDGFCWPLFTNIPIITLDSAIDFRPAVFFPDKKIVYLTENYKKLLDNFLGEEHMGIGEKKIVQPAHATIKSFDKMGFINNAATIFYGHWGGYWQYETYPEANHIIFNPDMSRALVYFRFKYEGGEVLLEKQNNEWGIVEVKYTWME